MSTTEFALQMPGTGTATGKRYNNNSALLTFSDYTLLIDCGSTVPLGLHQMGVKPDMIDGIFITHIHSDHVNGLEEMIWEYRYRYKKKIDLISEERLLQELWEHTIKGGVRWTTEGEVKSLDEIFNIVPISLVAGQKYSDKVDLSEHLSIDILRTPHIPQKDSYSLFINDEVFYSGDVRFDERLIYHADVERNVTTIFHDCQLHELSPVHASLKELLSLPESVQEKIWLMHYNDNMKDFIGETGMMEFLEQHVQYKYKQGTFYHGM